MRIRVLSVFLVILLLFTGTGCSQDFSLDYIIQSQPKNIDPQLASSDSEMLIVKNIFEGLFRYDTQGKLVNGVISSYQKNDLEYIFFIKEDACWNDGTPLTAQDFVFAFCRALDPISKAPNASSLLCIRNANAVYNGTLTASALGITALDDKTLKIQLEYADTYFLHTLASPIAMPCNEAFFVSCGGKYGLSEKNMLSNGSFKITKWIDQSKIRLNKNDKYIGAFPAAARMIYLSTADADAPPMQLLSNGNADLGEIHYNQITEAAEEGLQTTALQNTTYVLLFNKTGVFKNNNLRKAFALSVHRNLFTANLPAYFKQANSIFPQTVAVNYDSVQTHALQSKSIYEFDAIQARALFLEALNELGGSAPQITVLYEDDANIKGVLNDIVSQWQQVLGAYVNIQATSRTALLSGVKNGGYTIALYPLTDTDSSPHTFLQRFSSSSAANPIGFSDPSFDAALKGLTVEATALQSACTAERILLTDACIVPVFYSERTFAYDSSLKNIRFNNHFGNIDFAYIDK